MINSLVLGFFDGVHKAHRAVINSALDFANNVILITFKNSTSLYFDKTEEYIYSRANSIKKIKALGVKDVVELDFAKIANVSAEEYLNNLIEKYHPVSISTGYNHTFGLNKRGNSDFLKKYEKIYGYKYVCTPSVIENDEVVSSSLIKKYLKEGNVEYADKLLESNFILEGTVVHGAKLGRTIGFPTANIKYPEKIVKLPFGVYCATVNGHKAVMNWGLKPTVKNVEEPIIEVYILDFNEDIYGKDIKVEVIKQVRQEQKFDSLDELKSQIKKDVKKCLEL